MLELGFIQSSPLSGREQTELKGQLWPKPSLIERAKNKAICELWIPK